MMYYVAYMAGGRFHQDYKAVMLKEDMGGVWVTTYRRREDRPHTRWTPSLFAANCFVNDVLSLPVIGWVQLPDALLAANDGVSSLAEREQGLMSGLVFYQRTTGEIGASKIYQSLVGCTEAQSKHVIGEVLALFEEQFPPEQRRILAEWDTLSLLQQDQTARIQAIQRYRTYTRLPLNACRDAVDALRNNMRASS